MEEHWREVETVRQRRCNERATLLLLWTTKDATDKEMNLVKKMDPTMKQRTDRIDKRMSKNKEIHNRFGQCIKSNRY